MPLSEAVQLEADGEVAGLCEEALRALSPANNRLELTLLPAGDRPARDFTWTWLS